MYVFVVVNLNYEKLFTLKLQNSFFAYKSHLVANGYVPIVSVGWSFDFVSLCF